MRGQVASRPPSKSSWRGQNEKREEEETTSFGGRQENERRRKNLRTSLILHIYQ